MSENISDTTGVYITGNHPQLGEWNAAGVKMEKKGNNIWEKTFTFPEDTRLEYKFTLGNWQTEALDSTENVPANANLIVEKDTLIEVDVKNWNQTWREDRLVITDNVIKEKSRPLILWDMWKYHSGDNTEWKNIQVDDSKWKIYSSLFNYETRPSNWMGIGWFRVNFWVDKALWNKPVAINIEHLGASEVYLNGNLLFKTGVIQDGKLVEGRQRRNWSILTFDKLEHQVLAVRYANYPPDFYNLTGYDPGFSVSIINIGTLLSKGVGTNLGTSSYQIVFTLIPLVLAIIHFLLYIFYRKNRQNLFYSICLMGFAGFAFFILQRNLSEIPEQIIIFNRLSPLFINVAILFGLYTAYSGSYNKFPKRHYIFLTSTLIISLVGVFVSGRLISVLIYTNFVIVMIEVILTIYKTGTYKDPSSWFSAAGFFTLIFFVLYQILVDYMILDGSWANNVVYGYGVLGLIVFMSLSLSYNFSKTHKNLEEELITVEHLNKKTLEQERLAKEKEIETRLLEADNNRKTQELTDARNLQLSMLPKEIPDNPYCKVYTYLKTATEVGGDYYDFYLNNKSFTTVIGDATGHGAKAGTMVAATKSLFNALSDEEDLLAMIKKFTRSLKSMNLHNMFMSFAIVRVYQDKLSIANAGMPPALFYKSKENKVCEIILKSMPLGSFVDFPYEVRDIETNSNDILLLMSDGFMEAMNKENNLIGLESCKEILQKYVNHPLEEIIQHFQTALDEWLDGKPQDDDVTFLLIKII